MTRRLIPGALYGDHLPSGEWVVTIPHVHCLTHLGPVLFPPGETFGPTFPRCTNVNGFRFAGQAHDTLNPAAWEWEGDWFAYAPPCCGVNAVIYNHGGALFRADCAVVGSQGYRYVAADNTLVTGDATYGPFHGLFEYTQLADDLWIGQAAYDGGGVQVWDGAVLRQLELGDCRFVRANRAGETVALAFTKSEGVVLITTTMAELRALPPVVTPPQPEPPIPPDPEPPQPEPPKPTPEPPRPEPQPPIHEAPDMDIDGKIVILRGPAGLLANPDAPNTGTWAGLGAGWRGFRWAGAHEESNPACHHRAAKLANGRYTFTSANSGLAGADATKHSGSIPEQFYYKPDGNTDAGDYEQWRVYDGNENGAIEAQIEYSNDEGRYFACPLAVEVVG